MKLAEDFFPKYRSLRLHTRLLGHNLQGWSPNKGSLKTLWWGIPGPNGPVSKLSLHRSTASLAHSVVALSPLVCLLVYPPARLGVTPSPGTSPNTSSSATYTWDLLKFNPVSIKPSLVCCDSVHSQSCFLTSESPQHSGYLGWYGGLKEKCPLESAWDVWMG